MTDRARGALAAALAVAWAALIFWESSKPNPFPFLPSGLLSHDKLLHALAYGVLGALAAVALASGRLRIGRAVAAAALLATAYGATDEWHQSHVPNRDADVYDLVADAAGGLAGAALAVVILRVRMARASIRA